MIQDNECLSHALLGSMLTMEETGRGKNNDKALRYFSSDGI